MQSVSGGVKALLRLEAFAVLVAAVGLYAAKGGEWSYFAVFFLLPDLALLVYLIGPRSGAAAYNVSHSYLGSLILLFAGFNFHVDILVFAGLIWVAHIGFDRALGYGLKYSAGFRHTHLGRIGKPGYSELNGTEVRNQQA